MSNFKIGIVGNPNCGKTTLFNALTGAKQRVGNWPGVTVDRKVGYYRHGKSEIEVIDTPGIYSMSASSIDEKVARDFVLSGEADLIVNIVDASNIERNLYLTTQLIEMKVPMVIALNMMDVAEENGIKIDVDALSKKLGVPVVPIVASKGQGVEELKNVIDRALYERPVPSAEIEYPKEIQEAIEKLSHVLEEASVKGAGYFNRSWLALKLLEDDPDALSMVDDNVKQLVKHFQDRIEAELGEECDILIPSARYEFIADLTEGVVNKSRQVSETVSDKIDKIVLNRVLGIPIFLLAMYFLFLFVINVGGAFIDFFDILAGAIFVDGAREVLASLGSPQWLTTILADGIGGGIQTMATFIPPIGFMFLGLSFLEDSGYMARAAFVMDRFMRFIGLPGKSFIPMLVGFGCNVPAIMATRTLENERDRLLTIMMNPFMSCGARLPVYVLFAAVFFPARGQNIIFLLYLIGIGAAVLTGLILKNTLLKGDITPFVMELPPYHMPTIKSVVLRAYDRLQTFLFKAGRVLIPVIMVLAFLNSLGIDGTFGNEDSPKSVLASIGKTISPAFSSMGVKEENWPATVGIFTGVFAKEAVVGTLNSLYSTMGQEAQGGEEGEEGFSLIDSIKEAFATIPENLGGVAESLLDPLGIKVDTSNVDTVAEELEVEKGTFSAMTTLFGTKAAAFAYLLFVLLYFPCSAAIAAVYRETNLRWTAFAGFWTTFLAWSAATLYFQAATFSSHPSQSASWIAAVMTMFAAVVGALYLAGMKRGPAPFLKLRSSTAQSTT